MSRLQIVLGWLLPVFLAPACTGAAATGGVTQIVDVGGAPTRVMTFGLGDRSPDQPVLVLFSGAGAPIEAWGDWSSELSTLGPVVTYDRPGIGQSPFDEVEPTPEHVATHAHSLLGVLDVAPPYVLVGWSWGGPLARFYAGAFPDDVAGMVYLDPTDMTASPNELLGTSDEAELRRIYSELDAAMAERSRPRGAEAEQRVIRTFNRSEVADRGLPDDLDVPTTVVIATVAPVVSPNAPSYVNERWFEAMFARRVAQFGEWAQARPNASLIVASDSGHSVHLDAPAVAFEAVRSVVNAIASER